MSISTNLSFHGVSRIEISKESRHTIADRTWRARNITLYTKDNEECVSFQIHSPEDWPLTVELEEEDTK
jgi:hypothetical protein